jgi:hypothetical protein
MKSIYKMTPENKQILYSDNKVSPILSNKYKFCDNVGFENSIIYIDGPQVIIYGVIKKYIGETPDDTRRRALFQMKKLSEIEEIKALLLGFTISNPENFSEIYKSLVDNTVIHYSIDQFVKPAYVWRDGPLKGALVSGLFGGRPKIYGIFVRDIWEKGVVVEKICIFGVVRKLNKNEFVIATSMGFENHNYELVNFIK